jgi:hypothetical protein
VTPEQHIRRGQELLLEADRNDLGHADDARKLLAELARAHFAAAEALLFWFQHRNQIAEAIGAQATKERIQLGGDDE